MEIFNGRLGETEGRMVSEDIQEVGRFFKQWFMRQIILKGHLFDEYTDFWHQKVQ